MARDPFGADDMPRERPEPSPAADGSLAAHARDLLRRWLAVLLRPSIRTFAAQRPAASWSAVWASVAVQAVVEGIVVGFVFAGPAAAAGVSSLPVGPKLHLHVPAWELALLASAGTFFEFFGFSGLLRLSARLYGGQGSWRMQSYLLALFWTPLMLLSGLAQLLGTAGSVVGLLARLYALWLLAPMLAAAHQISPGRAWAAVLTVVGAGLLLGGIVLAVVGVPAGLLAK
jgi:hypothetical protein